MNDQPTDYTPRPDSFGVSPHEIVKSTDPSTSLAAAYKIDIDKQIWVVLQAIREQGGARSLGGEGVTGDDLQVLFGCQDQREQSVSYSSVLGHVVTLERQCYVERPGVTRPGVRFGNDQLIIWALTEQEQAAKLAARREGLDKPPTPEVFSLIERLLPLQDKLEAIKQELNEVETALLDFYMPDRHLGVWKAPLGRYTVDGELKDFHLRMELKRYSRNIDVVSTRAKLEKGR